MKVKWLRGLRCWFAKSKYVNTMGSNPILAVKFKSMKVEAVLKIETYEKVSGKEQGNIRNSLILGWYKKKEKGDGLTLLSSPHINKKARKQYNKENYIMFKHIKEKNEVKKCKKVMGGNGNDQGYMWKLNYRVSKKENWKV